MIVASSSTNPWTFLHHIIQAITVQCPDGSDIGDWTIAIPYTPTLNTLWSFCSPTTTNNLPTMYAVASAQVWTQKVHKEQLTTTHTTAKIHDSTAAIERLMDTIQCNTEYFGTFS
jgi:hypothetical protein